MINKIDTFNLDLSLAPIIANGLLLFKKDLKNSQFGGYPAGFETQNHLPLGAEFNCPDTVAMDKWIKTLDKMIFAFNAPEPELSDNIIEMSFNEKPHKNGDLECSINILDNIKYNDFIIRENKFLLQKQEGLDLFAKHYNDLWF